MSTISCEPVDTPVVLEVPASELRQVHVLPDGDVAALVDPGAVAWPVGGMYDRQDLRPSMAIPMVVRLPLSRNVGRPEFEEKLLAELSGSWAGAHVLDKLAELKDAQARERRAEEQLRRSEDERFTTAFAEYRKRHEVHADDLQLHMRKCRIESRLQRARAAEPRAANAGSWAAHAATITTAHTQQHSPYNDTLMNELADIENELRRRAEQRAAAA